jgi:hypothetical protein
LFRCRCHMLIPKNNHGRLIHADGT